MRALVLAMVWVLVAGVASAMPEVRMAGVSENFQYEVDLGMATYKDSQDSTYCGVAEVVGLRWGDARLSLGVLFPTPRYPAVPELSVSYSFKKFLHLPSVLDLNVGAYVPVLFDSFLWPDSVQARVTVVALTW